VAVLDWNSSSVPWTIDQVTVESIEDPVGRFVRRYADVSRFVANKQMGVVTLGTDFNGLNGLMDISEFPMPAGAMAASACTVTDNVEAVDASPPGPQPLAPMRFRNADGSLGAEVRIDERGLATYGLLADMAAIIRTYPGCGDDVYGSLMLSAEATIRAWEKIAYPPTNRAGSPAPLPTAAFACGPVPGLRP
jgi:hypothetical protein